MLLAVVFVNSCWSSLFCCFVYQSTLPSHLTIDNYLSIIANKLAAKAFRFAVRTESMTAMSIKQLTKAIHKKQIKHSNNQRKQDNTNQQTNNHNYQQQQGSTNTNQESTNKQQEESTNKQTTRIDQQHIKN